MGDILPTETDGGLPAILDGEAPSDEGEGPYADQQSGDPFDGNTARMRGRTAGSSVDVESASLVLDDDTMT